MKDQYGRTIDYLRISITDACNLRCRYCMPESAAGCALEQAEQNPPLTVEEMLKIVHAAAGLGITHYRITGGEPLVRKECVELVQKIKAVPGTASVGITTNGVRLASCARDLKAAGCDSVNVSLDTVDAAEFAALTGRDALEQVKQGICAAKEAGLLVKLNAVHRKELHAQELIEFAEQEKVPVRFIGFAQCIVANLCPGMSFGKVGGMGGYLVSDDPYTYVFLIRKRQMFFRSDIAEHGCT